MSSDWSDWESMELQSDRNRALHLANMKSHKFEPLGADAPRLRFLVQDHGKWRDWVVREGTRVLVADLPPC